MNSLLFWNENILSGYDDRNWYIAKLFTINNEYIACWSILIFDREVLGACSSCS